MELKRYWEIILRRRWVFISVFFSIALAFVLAAKLLTPIYKASAKILLEDSGSLSSLLAILNNSSSGGGKGSSSTSSSETYDSEIAQSTVRSLLHELIFKLQLRDRYNKLIQTDDLLETSLFYKIFPRPYLGVEQYEDSNILEISAVSASPEEARMMANTLAEMYINEQLRQRREKYKDIKDFVEGQISRLQSEYYNSLKNIRDFKVKEKTVSTSNEIEALIDRLTAVHKDYEGNELSIVKLKAAIAETDAKLSKVTKYRISSEKLTSNEQIQTLRKQLNGYMVDQAKLRTQKTADHPELTALQAQIDSTKKLLESEVAKEFESESTGIDPLYDTLVEDLAKKYIELISYEAQRANLKQLIAEYEEKLIAYPTRSVTQEQLELSLTLSQDMYKKFLGYRGQIALAEAITLSEIRLIDPADKPDLLQPYFPKKKLTYAIGLLLGLFLGLFTALLADYLDDTVKTLEDLGRLKAVTTLGAVPDSNDIRKSLISELNPKSPVVEAYRGIRNSVNYLTMGQPIKVLLIVSPEMDNGKTSTVANLGISISREGKRVLIMDLDLRNPSVHEKFGLKNTKGITNCLAGDASLPEVTMDSGVDGLKLILCGDIPPDPTRIIESPKLREVIEQLSLEYDIILIDTPPLMGGNDALVLGRYAQAVINVAESGKTTFQLLNHTNDLLVRVGLRMNGLILNKVKPEYSRYFAYN